MMRRMLNPKWALFCFCLLTLGTFFSCGTARKQFVSSDNRALLDEQDLLSPEERRRFDYFFLEAVRLKEKGDLDGAFEM